MCLSQLSYFSNSTSSVTKALKSPHIFVVQGDFASQNMMRSIARQVCEQLVNSEQNFL